MTPQQFIHKWKPVALTERATAQTHFIDLCALVGQWRLHNGIYARPEPILRKLDSIESRDAVIVQGREHGDARYIEAEWPEAEFVVGNPPFLGSRKMRPELGDSYVAALRKIYEDRVAFGADYVCFWFGKAWSLVSRGKTRRVGLIATKAITGGASRAVLEPIAAAGALFEVWRNEPWIVEGAAVRVAIICFSNEPAEHVMLDGKSASTIHSDLTAPTIDHDLNLTKANRLIENHSVSFQGVVPRSSVNKKKAENLKLSKATFVLSGTRAREILQLPLNPNGRPNSDVVVPFLVGDDITSRSRDRFIVDFREMSEAEAVLYEAPFEYIKPVRLHRAAMTQPEALATWWQHWRSRPELRKAIRGFDRYLAISRVSKHRLFVWIKPPTLPDNATVVVARDDDTCFGILQSRFHTAWSLRKGTTLEDRPRYTSTTTFETFAFPEGITPNIRAKNYADDPRAIAIAKSAKHLDDLRNAWLNPPDLIRIEPEVIPGYPDRILPKDTAAAVTLRERTLTNLYNHRPQWLIDVHRDLDAAVAAAYGWPKDISEEDALAKLLELNLQRAATKLDIVAEDAGDAAENGD